jgi:hypothetical protein
MSRLYFNIYNSSENRIKNTSCKAKRPFSLVVNDGVMLSAVVTPVANAFIPVYSKLSLGLSTAQPVEAQIP